MDRRTAIKSGAAAFLPFVKVPGNGVPVEGIGILRYPTHLLYDRTDAGMEGKVQAAAEIARELSKCISPGTILIMPSDRDEFGKYLWDFEVKGGRFDQVKIERQEESSATRDQGSQVR